MLYCVCEEMQKLQTNNNNKHNAKKITEGRCSGPFNTMKANKQVKQYKQNYINAKYKSETIQNNTKVKPNKYTKI